MLYEQKMEDRPEGATSERSRVGTCVSREFSHAKIISEFTGKRKSKFSPERGCLLVGWSMIFTTIGVACATKWFMDLLDKLEGRETD